MTIVKRDLYEAILGPRNAVYYLARFDRFDKNGGGLVPSWNWPAFLCTGVWALYRKLYGWFFVFWGVAGAASIAEKGGVPVIAVLIYLASMLAFGLYANGLYYRRLRRRITETAAAIPDEVKAVEHLRLKGGIHAWVPWVFGSIPVIGMVAAVALPVFHDQRTTGKADILARTKAERPTARSDTATLPLEAKDKISGKASISPGGLLIGNLYNGNPDWTVTEVTINVAEPDWFLRAIEAKDQGRPEPRLEKYRVEIVVPPYSNREFSVSVNWRADEKYEWNVWEARGLAQ